MMIVDARGLPWTHERFLPVQRTGCSYVLPNDGEHTPELVFCNPIGHR